MQVTYEKPAFHCLGAFKQKKDLHLAGLSYEPKRKSWFTFSRKIIAPYKDFFDEKTLKEFDKVCLKKTDIDTNKALYSIPKGERLDKVQIEGVRFSLTRNHSYLSFEAGVGKTPTFIVISETFKNIKDDKRPTLIIVPPHLITNWVNELNRWAPNKTHHRIDNMCGHVDKDADYIICADSLFLEDKAFKYSPVVEELKSITYSIIGVDEAQRFINFEANRTRQLFSKPKGYYGCGEGIVHQSEQVVLLSGTNMVRGPIDLYPSIWALAWDKINFMDRIAYGMVYCNGVLKKFGRRKFYDFNGSSREEIFRKKLYNNFILDRKLTGVKKHIERVVSLDTTQSLSNIRKLEVSTLSKKSLKDIVGSSDLGAIATYRKEVAKIKILPAYHYIRDILDVSDEKILVFGLHQELLLELTRMLRTYEPRLIYGKTKMKERDVIEKEFMSGKVRVINAQIQTMVGLNLQKATRCIFVESFWSPDKNIQAYRRAVRRGQKKTVVVEHLTLANTLDDYVLRTALKKQETINRVKEGV